MDRKSQGNWRLPTTKELSQLYIKDSKRKVNMEIHCVLIMLLQEIAATVSGVFANLITLRICMISVEAIIIGQVLSKVTSIEL